LRVRIEGRSPEVWDGSVPGSRHRFTQNANTQVIWVVKFQKGGENPPSMGLGRT
jgi:hypothetical protein